MIQEPQTEKNIWQTLYAIDRRWLYLILIIVVSILVVNPITVPNVVDPAAKSLYDYLSGLEEGDFVYIESDWTNSTRGESRGQFEALMRLLMRKKVRFCISTLGDPQIPDIIRPIINQIAQEPGSNNYQEGKDWVMAGYFPNLEAHVSGLVNNIRNAVKDKQFAGKSIVDTPVFEGINDLSDAKCVVVITGSSTINLWYERLRAKTKLGLMCTAVMSGENIPYYVSRQLVGIVIGAKGAFDFETLLAEEWPADEYPDYTNYTSGRRYMSPLFFALMLLILAVVVGNIAMIQLKKSGGRS
ncbi:MAG: hypothetical protein KatS3mg015_1783 [Fimbriimonadales bacterium]|nr:MAG: hypothetical protein KatS3mg015_1783 [Fimbriimonadales bacterium]